MDFGHRFQEQTMLGLDSLYKNWKWMWFFSSITRKSMWWVGVYGQSWAETKYVGIYDEHLSPFNKNNGECDELHFNVSKYNWFIVPHRNTGNAIWEQTVTFIHIHHLNQPKLVHGPSPTIHHIPTRAKCSFLCPVPIIPL